MTPTPPAQPAVRLSLPTDATPRTYRIKTDVEMHIGALTYENQQDMRLQFTPRPNRRASVRGLSFTQTNRTGEHRLDPDLAKLRHNLSLTRHPSGRIDTLDNHAELLAQFRALRTDYQRRFPNDPDLSPAFLGALDTLFADPDHLIRSLGQSPEFELLLPALYEQDYAYDQPTDGPMAFIAPLAGTLLVPLQTTLTRRPPQYPDVALDLLLTGRIDEARFPFDDTRTLLQELTGVVDIDPVPEIQYLLTFEFDRRHHLLHAGRFVTCIYENVAMSKVITMLGPDQPAPAVPAKPALKPKL